MAIVRSSLVLTLMGLLMLAGGCQSSEGQGFANRNYEFGNLSRVAVVGVQGDIRGEAAKGQITNFFNQQLLRKGYNPIERQQIKHILTEQNFQSENLTGTSGAAQIGKVLNVDAVVLVNIPQFGEELNMSAKMIDVEDASILWSASGTGKTGSGLNAITGGLVGGAAGAAAGGAASDGHTGITVASGAAGAAGGAVAGEALTPQKQTQARKVIEKLADSLPAGSGGMAAQPAADGDT